MKWAEAAKIHPNLPKLKKVASLHPLFMGLTCNVDCIVSMNTFVFILHHLPLIG